VYDPTVGGFLSVDPIVRDAAASQSWNGYGYVEGRVLSATDPSGWQTVDCPQCVVPIEPSMRTIVVTTTRLYALGTIGDFMALWGGVDTSLQPSAPANEEAEKEEPNSQKEQQCVRQPDNRSFGAKAADFSVGFGDAFLIPIIVRDLAGIEGTTDYDSAAYGAGTIAGVIEGLVPMALQGAAAHSAAAAARGAPSVLNANRYFRIGPGVGWGGTNVPRISSPFLPGDGHFSLTSRLPLIPPLGALFSAGGGGCSGGN